MSNEDSNSTPADQTGHEWSAYPLEPQLHSLATSLVPYKKELAKRIDPTPADEQSTATDESGRNNQKKSVPCCDKSQVDEEAASHGCQCSCSGRCRRRDESAMESYMPQGLKEGLKRTLGDHSVHVEDSIVTISAVNGTVIQGSDIDRSKIDGSIVRGSEFGADRRQK